MCENICIHISLCWLEGQKSSYMFLMIFEILFFMSPERKIWVKDHTKIFKLFHYVQSRQYSWSQLDTGTLAAESNQLLVLFDSGSWLRSVTESFIIIHFLCWKHQLLGLLAQLMVCWQLTDAIDKSWTVFLTCQPIRPLHAPKHDVIIWVFSG